MADTEGLITVEVTETCWTTVTVRVDEELLEEYGCADIIEFCRKVRTKEIHIFDLHPEWDSPYDSEVQDVDYQFAKALDAKGNELEVPDDY
jgi:hypothetical protein